MRVTTVRFGLWSMYDHGNYGDSSAQRPLTQTLSTLEGYTYFHKTIPDCFSMCTHKLTQIYANWSDVFIKFTVNSNNSLHTII